MPFGLSCRCVEVEAQDVQHAQEGPQVFGGDRRSFQCTDDVAELVALVDGLLRDETIERQAPLKFLAVSCSSRAVEQSDKILEKSIRAAQRDEDQSVVLGFKGIRLLEI